MVNHNTRQNHPFREESPSTSSLYQDFKRLRNIVQQLPEGEHAILQGIEPSNALSVLESVESEGTTKEKRLRASYNSETRTLLVTPMPVYLHDCCQPWLVDELILMARRAFVSEAEQGVLGFFVGTSIDTFQGQYANSIKQPDAAWGVDAALIPTMTVEVGWSESHPQLLRDIRVWMEGSGGLTRISILIKMARRAGGKLAAYMEVARQLPGGGWGWDARQDLFPPNPNQLQTVAITRQDMFGPNVVAGANPTDVWLLSLDIFRRRITTAAAKQGLAPLL